MEKAIATWGIWIGYAIACKFLVTSNFGIVGAIFLGTFALLGTLAIWGASL